MKKRSFIPSPLLQHLRYRCNNDSELCIYGFTQRERGSETGMETPIPSLLAAALYLQCAPGAEGGWVVHDSWKNARGEILTCGLYTSSVKVTCQ